MSQAKKTTDHTTIREWVEKRGGRPATVSTTASKNEPGILRIDFPEAEEDQNLEGVDWSAFFKKFDDEKLAFLYQEETEDGHKSRFNKFVRRED